MKKYIHWIIAAMFLMIGCPWLAVRFAGDAGMAICFILFFAVDPLFSVFCGIFSGSQLRLYWSLPLLNAALFLLGSWIFFDMGEPAFLQYAGCYLMIGTAAMLLTAFVKSKKE